MATMRSILLLGLLPSLALAESDPDEAYLAQLEVHRQEIAGEIQLASYNLVDELVYGWTQDPLFVEPTPVVLAGVTVPVGLGTALKSLLENHITAVLLKNPKAQVTLTHCPACTAVIVHSGAKGTVISRGVDNPEALGRLTKDNKTRHALFVDIEAEGSYLVLRARITKLNQNLPIIWARTISSKASTPSMLREPEGIKSVQQARQEMIDAIEDQWPISIPARLSVRLFKDDQAGAVNPPPFIWIQSGVELYLSEARAWTASFLLGYGYVPSSYDGFMAQVRVHRLLTGTARSYTHPDLYFFAGSSIFMVWGPSAQIFQRRQTTTEEVIAAHEGNDQPNQVFMSVHAGLELRLGNRLGAAIFGEMLPAHVTSDFLGTYSEIFHAIGAEVSVWF